MDDVISFKALGFPVVEIVDGKEMCLVPLEVVEIELLKHGVTAKQIADAPASQEYGSLGELMVAERRAENGR